MTKQITYMKKEKETVVSSLEINTIQDGFHYPTYVIIDNPKLESPGWLIKDEDFPYAEIYTEKNSFLYEDASDALLTEVFKCLKYKSKAAEELASLCLNIASNGLYGNTYKNITKDYADVARIGLSLLATLCRCKLYSEDRLKYVYVKNTNSIDKRS